MKQLRTIVTIGFSLVLFLASCTPNTPENTLVAPVDEVDELEDGDSLEQTSRHASPDSAYAGVILYLEETVDTQAPAGAAAGTLQLIVRFENTTDAVVSLPFESDDYIIRDDAGLATVPSVAAPELINPEIAAGESVSGVLEYAVTNATGTFSFHVGTYDEITFSESVAD